MRDRRPKVGCGMSIAGRATEGSGAGCRMSVGGRMSVDGRAMNGGPSVGCAMSRRGKIGVGRTMSRRGKICFGRTMSRGGKISVGGRTMIGRAGVGRRVS